MDVVDHVLVGMVVDEDVDGSHLLHGSVDDFLAFFLLLEVDLDEVAGLTVLLDLLLGLLGILLLDLEVGNQAVGALHGEHDGNRTTDAGVASGDDGLLALQLASGLVELVAAVLGGNVLVDGIRALHIFLDTRGLLVRHGDGEVCWESVASFSVQ